MVMDVSRDDVQVVSKEPMVLEFTGGVARDL